MPANYAHYRFGRDVLKRLPELAFLHSGHCRQAFLTGLHGPDLLFFHNPLKRDAICQLGYAMHRQPARVFFEQMCIRDSRSAGTTAGRGAGYGRRSGRRIRSGRRS